MLWSLHGHWHAPLASLQAAQLTFPAPSLFACLVSHTHVRHQQHYALKILNPVGYKLERKAALKQVTRSHLVL